MPKFEICGVLTVILFSVLINKSLGLQCYICSITEDDADTSCADNPSALDGGTLDCDKKYCTLVRIDYKDPRGKLSSLSRSCADQPIFTNQVIEDETFRSYFRSCKTDLCNSGSGRTDSREDSAGNLGDKSTIYCPGVDSDGAIVTSLTVPVFLLMLCHYFL